jgi:hypothetical protein
VWNAFSFERSLNINFDDEGPESIGFDAVVRNFDVVPEQATSAFAALAAAVISMTKRLKRYVRG